MIFDTLNFVKRLTAPGLPLGPYAPAREHANPAPHRPTTKHEPARLRQEVKRDIAGVSFNIAGLSSEIAVHQWMTGFVVTGCLSLILKNFS